MRIKPDIYVYWEVVVISGPISNKMKVVPQLPKNKETTVLNFLLACSVALSLYMYFYQDKNIYFHIGLFLVNINTKLKYRLTSISNDE